MSRMICEILLRDFYLVSCHRSVHTDVHSRHIRLRQLQEIQPRTTLKCMLNSRMRSEGFLFSFLGVWG